MRLLLLFGLTLLLSIGGVAQELEIGPFRMDNPLGPTSVTKTEKGVYTCHWPASVPLEQAEVQLLVVVRNAEDVAAIREAGERTYDSVLLDVMGLSGQPTGINKTLFFGKTGARSTYDAAVPRPHEAHVYSKVLSGGRYLLIGVRAFGPKFHTGGLTRAIGNTFREL